MAMTTDDLWVTIYDLKSWHTKSNFQATNYFLLKDSKKSNDHSKFKQYN